MRTTCQLLDSAQLPQEPRSFREFEPNRKASELSGAGNATMAVRLLQALNSTVNSFNFPIQRNTVIAVKRLRRLR